MNHVGRSNGKYFPLRWVLEDSCIFSVLSARSTYGLGRYRNIIYGCIYVLNRNSIKILNYNSINILNHNSTNIWVIPISQTFISDRMVDHPTWDMMNSDDPDSIHQTAETYYHGNGVEQSYTKAANSFVRPRTWVMHGHSSRWVTCTNAVKV